MGIVQLTESVKLPPFFGKIILADVSSLTLNDACLAERRSNERTQGMAACCMVEPKGYRAYPSGQ